MSDSELELRNRKALKEQIKATLERLSIDDLRFMLEAARIIEPMTDEDAAKFLHDSARR